MTRAQPGESTMMTRFRYRVRTSIRTKLTVSHLVVVMLSLLVYAFGGFLLFLILFWGFGPSSQQLRSLVPAVAVLTAFTLSQVVLIMVCGIFVASLASSFISRRMTRQIDALEAASEAFSRGRLNERAEVLSHDELGRLAERFNLLAERLYDLDVQRRSFVANVSHDLRTPLAIIHAHVEAQLNRSDIDPVAMQESLTAIEHETQTLAKLIDDLFTHSRIEEAALPLRSASVDVAKLSAESVYAIRQYALKMSRVSVNSLVAEDTPSVKGDETRIQQVLTNLLHNAVRHTQAGGVVAVEASVVERGQAVEVVVRDTGVGIAPDELPHIFDRFYRGESTRGRGGAGLGLSIVKQLVEMQGGRVLAESTLGEGTAIGFRLPAVARHGAVERAGVRGVHINADI